MAKGQEQVSNDIGIIFGRIWQFMVQLKDSRLTKITDSKTDLEKQGYHYNEEEHLSKFLFDSSKADGSNYTNRGEYHADCQLLTKKFEEVLRKIDAINIKRGGTEEQWTTMQTAN